MISAASARKTTFHVDLFIGTRPFWIVFYKVHQKVQTEKQKEGQGTPSKGYQTDNTV